MKDRDCESCKKFSRGDPHESEGYCEAKRTWVDPQEGEDCKMHEFTLWSATKYKDGAPIMSEPEVDINSSYPESITKPESNQLDRFKHRVYDEFEHYAREILNLEQRVDELSEEYDAVLKTHGDTLEEHLDRICDLEHMHESVLEKLSTLSEDVSINESNIGNLDYRVDLIERKILDMCRFLDAIDVRFKDISLAKERVHCHRLLNSVAEHVDTNFCGNCVHCDCGKQGDDEVYVCELACEIVDPDSASCSMFEPPF